MNGGAGKGSRKATLTLTQTLILNDGAGKGSRKASRAAERERIAVSAAAKVEKRKRKERDDRKASVATSLPRHATPLTRSPPR